MSTVPGEIVARLASLPVAAISQTLYAKGLRSRFLYGLRLLNPKLRFAGPAHTVRAIPVREDLRDAVSAGKAPNLHRQAFAAARKGDVIVVSGDGVTGVSLLGDIIATSLQVRGIAGVVTDSDVADESALSAMDFPVVCVGSAPVPSPAKLMVVDHGAPLGIAGVAVFPGDIIVGDANGAVCVPAALAAEVADKVAEKEILEEFLIERVRAGAPLDGTYPPDAKTLTAYEAWRRAKS
jgi:regulator of RNase E activity RraA